jgi:hypothetical protein
MNVKFHSSLTRIGQFTARHVGQHGDPLDSARAAYYAWFLTGKQQKTSEDQTEQFHQPISTHNFATRQRAPDNPLFF